jgi:PAS domain S-box-containing protein
MKKKILMVDDEPGSLFLLEALLNANGLETAMAENGKEALAMARLNPPDLIVSDILMPVMDGYTLCREWKLDETLRSIPFVFYTAEYTRSRERALALSLDPDDFILKPQEPHIMIRLLIELLEKRKPAKPKIPGPAKEEIEFLRKHDKILFGKLEKKMADLEKANEELREQEEKYRLSFEQVSDVIFILGTDLRILSISPSVERNLGYHPLEFVGKPFAKIKKVMDPGCYAQASAKLASILEGKTVEPSDYIIFAKDGTLRHIETSATPVVKNGKTICIVCVTHDITQRKRAEESLINERNFSRTVAESLPGLFFVLDERGKFLRWNDNLRAVTGYADEEIREMLFADLCPQSHRNAALEGVKEILRAGELSSEAELIFKDGTRRIFRLNARRLSDEDRLCIVGAGMDVTDRKKAENELKRFAESLEEANIALRVLMHQRDEDQKDIEEKLQANVHDLILPCLKKLKGANLEDRYKNDLQTLEYNLREILSPFLKNILAAHADLTPREIQIMDLIKQGKKTGEIAAALNASLKTVETHRNHIRKKLNLVNAGVNLRSYLLSVS